MVIVTISTSGFGEHVEELHEKDVGIETENCAEYGHVDEFMGEFLNSRDVARGAKELEKLR